MADDEPQQTTASTPASPATDGVTAKVGSMEVHISEKQLPMLGMFGSAIVLLTALVVGDDNVDNYAYGISVAVVVMFFSLGGLIYYQYTSSSSDSSNVAGQGLAYFLFVWCFVGAGVLTFRGPFDITGNGYFSAWAMATFGIMAVGVSGENVQSVVSGYTGSLVGLGASAVVVLCDVADELDGSHKGESIYALVVSCVTVLVVAVLYRMDQSGEDGNKAMAVATCALFAILWIVLACLVTFRGPFLFTGNGYFGSWGGAIMAAYALKGAHSK